MGQEYVNINGAWVANKAKYVNINGTWVRQKAAYVNINGTWVQYYTDPASLIKLSFVQERFNSRYGFMDIQPTYVTIASGYSGVGTCAARSNSSFKLNAGDVITVSMMHTSVSGSTYISSTAGQAGRVYISDNKTFTLGTIYSIYDQKPSGTMGNYFQKTLTVPASGTYYFHIGVYGSASYDTHLIVNGIWINGHKAF